MWAMRCLDLQKTDAPEGGEPETADDEFPLHLNQATGKVEIEPPPIVGSPQISFNTSNLRRQISFILDESIDEQCSSPAFRVAAAC